MEGMISFINRHKRIAKLDLPILGETVDTWVSLEVLSKVEDLGSKLKERGLTPTLLDA